MALLGWNYSKSKLKGNGGPIKEKRQINYRTATTTYPCFLPNLGDL
jgi:hypothetical protein